MTCTAFAGTTQLATGSLVEVALAVRSALDEGTTETILVFDNATGRVFDLDLCGTPDEIVVRLAQRVGQSVEVPSESEIEADSVPRGRGRPKLGVIPREVTLLPRHWEWLAAQPGGASATLRRLIDEARKSGAAQAERRAAQDAAYHFMHAIAGDFPGYEEATRALFADDRPGLERQIAAWPPDIHAFVLRLAFRNPNPSTVQV